MSRLRSWFLPPPSGDEPKATFRWIRNWEIISGVVLIALGIGYWGEAWWSWAMLGMGVLSLLPWPGAGALLRKAERQPEAFITDPQRRRERARRVGFVMVPLYMIFGAVIGYVMDGWPAAAFISVLLGIGGVLGAWWTARRERP